MTDIHVLLPDNLHLDFENECVWRGEQAIQLTPKAFALLRYLAERPGQLVTKDELLKAVWPEVIVSEGVLTTHMGVIRQALGDNAKKPRYIETVHRRGYRFIGSVASSQHSVVSSSQSELTPNPQHPAPMLVGREAELEQLHGWLDKALNGERQMVFVTGEPGIGKTALVNAFLQSLESRVSRLESEGQDENQKAKIENPAPNTQHLAPGVWLGWGQCIEQHGAGEAYLPVLEALGRLCHTPKREHLIALLHHYAPTWLAQLPALLNVEQQEALQRQTLGATKTRMLREMAEALEALTAEHPLVLWLEDLHWSDASTLDLLAMVARRHEPARLLVIGSYRPVEVLGNGHPLLSLTQELHGHHRCSELAPRLLTAREIDAYLQQRFPISVLPSDWAQTLAHHSGGNPLFLVTAVDDLVDRGVLGQVDACWTLQSNGETSELGAPESLRQLIARQSARLLPQEQKILEAASVAGMEFSAAAVAAALAAETVDVEEQCAGLADRQQFLRAAGISEWPDGTGAARYSFLHAMYQHLWHERVTPVRQVRFHLRIGERKEAAYGARAGEIATELAVHFEQGRAYRRAIRYLQQAARNALQRSAHVEAIQHLTKGLELLALLPDTPERVQQEFTLQSTLGLSLIATKGLAAPEVEKAYTRARELSRQVEETPELFPVLRGLAAFYGTRGELRTAYKLGKQLLSLEQNVQDPTHLVEAHYIPGVVLFAFGELTSAREHFEQGIAFYDPQEHRSLAFLYGHDPGMACLSFTAHILWLLGYPDQALKRMEEALSWAQELSYPYNLAVALAHAAQLHQYRREGQAAQEQAEMALALATEHGFALVSALGNIWRGWARAEQSQGEEGTSRIRQGLDALRAIGVKLWRSHHLTLLAQAHGKAGQPEAGLNALAKALEVARKTGDRSHEAELYRIKGELLLAQADKSLS